MLFLGSNLTLTLAVTILLAALIGMTVHEFAHNYVAYLAGDMTPVEQGRLTLDPSVHIYWPGFIMFVLIGFGILGTAPINPYRMRNPRWGYLAAVAAGPFSNLGIAAIGGLIFRIIPDSTLYNNDQLFLALYYFVMFNVFLFLFNLLPFQPLDGWTIMYTLLPADQAVWWRNNAQTTQYIFLGLILLSFAAGSFLPYEFDILGYLIRDIGGGITRFLLGV